MPTAAEFRAGLKAAERTAIDAAAPWPTMPAPCQCYPCQVFRESTGREFNDNGPRRPAPPPPRERPPFVVLELARRDPTVAAHVTAYGAGSYDTVADMLVALVYALTERSRHHVARELRRLQTDPGPRTLKLTPEEFAALNVTFRGPPVMEAAGPVPSSPFVTLAPRDENPPLPPWPGEPSPMGNLYELWRERQRARATAEPTGYTNAPASWGTTTAEAPTVESIRDAMRKLPKPDPEQVIVTPSLDALRAVVPFAVELDPTGRRTMTGVRVVVTKYAARPQLIPAEVFDSHWRNLPGVMA